MRKEAMGWELTMGKKSDAVGVHDEEKSDRVRVVHEKKSDGVRVDHKKERWGKK